MSSEEKQQFEDETEKLFKTYTSDGDHISKANAISFLKEVFTKKMAPLNASQRGHLISKIEETQFEVLTKVQLQEMIMDILGLDTE